MSSKNLFKTFNASLRGALRDDLEIKHSAIKTLWIATLVICIDQVTKLWAVDTLVYGEPLPFLPFLNWTLAYNYGAAFSFLADMRGWQRGFFAVVALVVSIVLVVWLTKLPRKLTVEVWGVNLVLGGAIGNVLDRILEGRVTDFIDFYIGSWHFATFNIADVGISIGAALLIYSEFYVKPKLEKIEKRQKEFEEKIKDIERNV